MSHPKESSQFCLDPHINVTSERKLTNFVPEAALIDVTSQRELTLAHPKESSQICLRGPFHWCHIQERAHKFVSEALLIGESSRRELNNLCFRGATHR
jgi:hypothetical protein